MCSGADWVVTALGGFTVGAGLVLLCFAHYYRASFRRLRYQRRQIDRGWRKLEEAQEAGRLKGFV